MLYVCIKMHQNAFDGRAQPGPTGSLQCSPGPVAGLQRTGRERKRPEEGTGRTPQHLKCADAPLERAILATFTYRFVSLHDSDNRPIEFRHRQLFETSTSSRQTD